MLPSDDLTSAIRDRNVKQENYTPKEKLLLEDRHVILGKATHIRADDHTCQLVNDQFAEVVDQPLNLVAQDADEIIPGDLTRQLRLAEGARAVDVIDNGLCRGENKRAGEIVPGDGEKVTSEFAWRILKVKVVGD